MRSGVRWRSWQPSLAFIHRGERVSALGSCGLHHIRRSRWQAAPLTALGRASTGRRIRNHRHGPVHLVRPVPSPPYRTGSCMTRSAALTGAIALRSSVPTGSQVAHPAEAGRRSKAGGTPSDRGVAGGSSSVQSPPGSLGHRLTSAKIRISKGSYDTKALAQAFASAILLS